MNTAEYYQLNKHKYNTPEAQARRKAYRSRTKQQRAEYNKERNLKLKGDPLIKEKSAAYYQKNKARANEMAYKRYKKKIITDPIFKLTATLRQRYTDKIKLYKGVKKKLKTDDILGCTVAEVKCHIESLWLPGMSWDNYSLHGWHIDHIIPLNTFDLLDIDQQKKAFHYTNLRPLWASDNWSRPKDGSDVLI